MRNKSQTVIIKNNKVKSYVFLCLFLCFFTNKLKCQSQKDNLAKHQISLRHDNDFFALTDYYYSSGLFLSYTVKPNKVIFNPTEQWQFTLGQEVYTPSQTQSTNVFSFDRPYAGFTGLTTLYSTGRNNHLWQSSLQIGLAGNNSGAGGFQRWYHRVIAIADAPLWVAEVNNSLHLNLAVDYCKEWIIAPNPFGVTIAVQPSIALGSRDAYAKGETIWYFGTRNSTANSIAYNRLSLKRELYFALRAGYRHVFYNGLIQGNAFGDTSTFLTKINTDLLQFGFDFNHRYGNNNYCFGIRHNTAETPQATSHTYVILSYGLVF